MDIDKIFKRAADAREIDIESYKKEIAFAVECCYASEDPKVRAYLEKLFPEKPSPEQFVSKLVMLADNKNADIN